MEEGREETEIGREEEEIEKRNGCIDVICEK